MDYSLPKIYHIGYRKRGANHYEELPQPFTIETVEGWATSMWRSGNYSEVEICTEWCDDSWCALKPHWHNGKWLKKERFFSEWEDIVAGIVVLIIIGWLIIMTLSNI